MPPADSASQKLDRNISSFVIFKTDDNEVFKKKAKTSSGHNGLSTKMINYVHHSYLFSWQNILIIVLTVHIFQMLVKLQKLSLF